MESAGAGKEHTSDLKISKDSTGIRSISPIPPILSSSSSIGAYASR